MFQVKKTQNCRSVKIIWQLYQYLQTEVIFSTLTEAGNKFCSFSSYANSRTFLFNFFINIFPFENVLTSLSSPWSASSCEANQTLTSCYCLDDLNTLEKQYITWPPSHSQWWQFAIFMHSKTRELSVSVANTMVLIFTSVSPCFHWLILLGFLTFMKL